MNLRVFHIHPGGVAELPGLPERLPAHGFVWAALARTALAQDPASVQAALQRLTGLQLVDLHLSDLLNAQLPSHYDYTSQYDLLVFRRLAAATGAGEAPVAPAEPRGGPSVLRRIDTSAVGFALFDHLLLSVHPSDCAVRDTYAQRLLSTAPAAQPGAQVGTNGHANSRMPASPADLMLRVVNQIVDGYLELRRDLTRQLDHWQTELLRPRTRFANWNALLQARLALHQLDEVCEDQRSAMQDWIDALETWALPESPAGQRELDLLKVRSRDVLEHIERVVHHVRRLEQSSETAVQMHFNVQSHRTNDIMRTLTALTAVFLPLNLIAGIFGMNFEFLPLIHKQDGFWWALGAMGVMALALVLLFWRKRYLARSSRG